MYLTFYSRRRGRQENILLELLEDGWLMTHECYNGKVRPDGHPHLGRCIKENYAPYPPAFGDAMEEIWEAARAKRLSQHEIQSRLDRFSAWLQAYERDKSIMLTDIC